MNKSRALTTRTINDLLISFHRRLNVNDGSSLICSIVDEVDTDDDEDDDSEDDFVCSLSARLNKLVSGHEDEFLIMCVVSLTTPIDNLSCAAIGDGVKLSHDVDTNGRRRYRVTLYVEFFVCFCRRA